MGLEVDQHHERPIMSRQITQQLFLAHLQCKYKSHLKQIGTIGSLTDIEVLDTKLDGDFRERAVQHLCDSYLRDQVARSPDSTERAVAGGYHLITDVLLSHQELVTRVDALLRVRKQSPSRSQYAPALFVRGDKPTKLDKAHLAFAGLILQRMFGKEVRFGRLILGKDFTTKRVELTRLFHQVENALEEITRNGKADDPPPLRLNAHCHICEFAQRCRLSAVERDDLSLLRGMTEKGIAKYNKRGVFTVTQLSYTYRPRRTRKRNATVGAKHDHSLQALAIREGTIIVAKKPHMPVSEQNIFLDIEGNLEQGSMYLIGAQLCGGAKDGSHSLWADGEADERAIWIALLDLLASLRQEYTVFHFGSFDSRAVEQMRDRHGGDPDLLDQFTSSFHNVLSDIYGRVYFPTFSNGLKDIANYLGFRWSEPDASGLKSLVWRQQWLDSRNNDLKSRLLRYNQEDCLALKRVTDTLFQISQHQGESVVVDTTSPVRVQGIPSSFPNVFNRNDFFFPDLAHINRCAYFDYQRDKIYVRTSDEVKRSIRRGEVKRRCALRVNKEVAIGRPTNCPQCAGTDLIGHGRLRKTVYDLKLFNGGVKRWVVRYKASRYLCRTCGKAFAPPEWRSNAASKYGPVLLGWMVYHNISLFQPHSAISDEARELFGYSFDRGIASRFKQKAASLCKSSYEWLLDRISRGNLVHADETPINIKRSTGYVWTFTNLQEVAYVYSDTRDGEVARTTLSGFNGVLVSDFYSAYDSLSCKQQKCLIHLMRDMNADLFKNQIDDELKEVCREFAGLLRAIVETVDRYGLKKRNLAKHRRAASRFIERLARRNLSSDVAVHYQKRIVKYGDKLFTFLTHDGVPWNNNNAEHAIKRFALLRQVITGVSTASGIRDYLVLLSICETLRRKNLSFLDFLVAGDNNLAKYVERMSS
jgi:predicted RecB family nuclease